MLQELLGLPVLQEPLVQQDQRVLPVRMVPMERLVLQVLKVQLVSMALSGRQVPRGLQERLAHRVQLVPKDQPESLIRRY